MELSKIADVHTIAKSNKVNEDELQSFEEAYNHPDKAQRDKGELHATHSSKFVRRSDKDLSGQ